MSDSTFATGKCLCGSVNYEISAEPIRMAQCHCKGCQRASGSGHMSLAFFKEESVKINGEIASYGATADSGNVNERFFCPVCGSRLFGKNSAREGIIAVTAGSVDDNAWFDSQFIVYCKDRPDWDATRTDVPNHDTMPG